MTTPNLLTQLKKAWDVFLNRDPTYQNQNGTLWTTTSRYGYTWRPEKTRLTRGNENTIVASIYERISNDVAAISFRHAEYDEDGKLVRLLNSRLNNLLTVEANIDQTARNMIQDFVLSMLDEGAVAIVPVIVDDEATENGNKVIYNVRVGKIVDWGTRSVKIDLYNELNGQINQVDVRKESVAIINNPFYEVANRPNSVAKRLIRKLALLDSIDEQSASGKLNMIIQLPYQVVSERQKLNAETRRKTIENQLIDSKYGIAYTDGTERITQLNQPIENNLLKQIEYLQSELFRHFGISSTILDGTAGEQEMLNYYNSTIEPIASALADELNRKFISPKSRKNGQRIMFFRDPFKLVPLEKLSDVADTLVRNTIVSPNEMRQVIGFIPSPDKKADELRNPNISESKETQVTEKVEVNENGKV